MAKKRIKNIMTNVRKDNKMARYVIGGDVGSSGYKTVLLDIESGEIKATANVSYEVDWVKPNWAQQDPFLWKDAFVEATRKLTGYSGIRNKEIEGIAFSGQQHGAVVVDGENQPLHQAILWCCQRSARECQHIEESVARETAEQDAYIKEIGMHAMAGFQGPKVLWLYNNLPQIYQKVEQLLFPKDWLKTEISREKEWTTELSDLSGSGYLKLDGTVSELAMRVMKVSQNWIPKILPSTSCVGSVSGEVAKETGLSVDTKIFGGGGDNPCSMLGNNAYLLESVGTSGTFSVRAKQPIVDGTLHPFVLPDDRFNHPRGSRQPLHCIIDAASAIDYIAAIVYGKGKFTYDMLNRVAQGTPAGSRGKIIVPFIHGQRVPYAPQGRLYIKGYASDRDKKEDLIRAAMEGVAYAMKYGFELLREGMRKQGIVEAKRITVTGGGTKGEEASQIRSEVYGKELVNPHTEGAAVGAAYIAAAGLLDEPVEEVSARLFERGIQANTQKPSLVVPRDENIRLYEEGYERYLEVLEEAFKNGFEQESLI